MSRGHSPEELPVVALAGNPNVGKSTLFNRLTGLRQHTGNWPGKTVELAWGTVDFDGIQCRMVDLPGTYSLRSHSREEEVAEEFLKTREPDCTVVVCDGTSLERNLHLALQILERTGKVILCINLMDEAERQGIRIDAEALATELRIPVVTCAAGRTRNLELLKSAIRDVVTGTYRCGEPRDFGCPVQMIREAERLAKLVIRNEGVRRPGNRMDRLLVRPLTGVPLMLLMLFGIFWLTIYGANVPSALLQRGFDRLALQLRHWTAAWPVPLSGLLIDGVFATVGRVVSVMLPPMAIFFPLFTLLEDWGLLPRIAFLLDRRFAACGACGKQGLTMCMGLGCNAVGVTGCRIIDSPRERLIAILTNTFMPCNGRYPAMIVLITVFFAEDKPLVAALILTAVVLLGILVTFCCSRILSRTALKGTPSSFVMELPPYRRPDFGRVIVRSLLDRTVFVLGRAVIVAAPAGLVIWVLANGFDGSLLKNVAGWLEPFGRFLGMDGQILLSFLLALPANELVLPVLLMQMTGVGGLAAAESAGEVGALLCACGWTWKTALCTLLFSLLHWPCSTTLLTIRKETGSLRCAAAAFLLPTAVGVMACAAVHAALQML